MQKVIGFFIGSILILGFAFFRQAEGEKVNWLTVAEMQAAYSKNPKPILVDVYTSWCGWCKVMDKETYSNGKVAAYINEKYYAVKFDAEGQAPVEWNGVRYEYDAQNKINGLAGFLLYGQFSYPTTVFLSSLNAKPAPLAGYLKPKEIESPLKFFGDGIYKTKTFPEFMKEFKSGW
jgi:uncharacterized protein YyaL (SSP411 family)